MNDWFKNELDAEYCVDRRRFLRIGVLAGAASLTPFSAWAGIMRDLAPERALVIYNTHTGEQIKAVYCENGSYVPEAVAEISRVLRDHRSNEICAIDARLLDLLHGISTKIEARQPLHIISGYRSPRTNAQLAARSRKVAKHSLHMQGMAVDIRVPGRDLAQLRKVAVALKGGGVGYYPKSDFVHVDVGRVRYW
ncbi:MAG: DUF882 domain-containing protein [Pseudomonadota bacterium]